MCISTQCACHFFFAFLLLQPSNSLATLLYMYITPNPLFYSTSSTSTSIPKTSDIANIRQPSLTVSAFALSISTTSPQPLQTQQRLSILTHTQTLSRRKNSYSRGGHPLGLLQCPPCPAQKLESFTFMIGSDFNTYVICPHPRVLWFPSCRKKIIWMSVIRIGKKRRCFTRTLELDCFFNHRLKPLRIAAIPKRGARHYRRRPTGHHSSPASTTTAIGSQIGRAAGSRPPEIQSIRHSAANLFNPPIILPTQRPVWISCE